MQLVRIASIFLLALGAQLSGADVCYGKLGCYGTSGAFSMSTTRPISLNPASPDRIKTKFYLYTREDKKSGPQLDARYLDRQHLVDQWTWIKNRPTKIIIHGFMDVPANIKWMKAMKDAFLTHGDYNVVIVDWSGGNQLPYSQAVGNTRVVGAQVSELIDLLVDVESMTAADFHIVGHSLGAHTAGYAGEKTPGLGRITGLDPAGPYFEGTDKVVRLDPTDADFVDVIHTDGNPTFLLGFGIDAAVGHMDFYPNSGYNQPGCELDPVGQLTEYGLQEGLSEIGACNHLRSYKFFTESINADCPFMAFPCASEEDFKAGKCWSCTGSGCASLGFRADQFRPANSGRVKYYVNTAEDAPFCQYQVQVTVTLSSEDVPEDRGNLKIKLVGDKGTSADIKLTSDPVTLKPGEAYTFNVGTPTDVGSIQAVDVTWNHARSLTDISSWNLFGLDTPVISLGKVDVYQQDTQARVQFCAGSKQVDSGKTLRVSAPCSSR